MKTIPKVLIVAPNEKIANLWLDQAGITSDIVTYINDAQRLRGYTGVLFIINIKYIETSLLQDIYEVTGPDYKGITIIEADLETR